MEVNAKDIAAQLRKPEGELGQQVAEKMNESNRPMTEFTYGHLTIQPGDHVLEIGFGNGRLLPLLLDRMELKVTGIDLSSDMVALAKTFNASYLDKGCLSLSEANVSDLPFEVDSFDAVCSINTLYFWEDPIACAQQIFRVLKSGGCLCLGLTPKNEMKLLPPTQFGFNLYEDEEVISILKSAGFTKMEMSSRLENPIKIGDQEFQFHSMVIKAVKSSNK